MSTDLTVDIPPAHLTAHFIERLTGQVAVTDLLLNDQALPPLLCSTAKKACVFRAGAHDGA